MDTRRTVTNGILLLVFAFVCIAAMEVLAFNIGQPKPFASNYTLSAYFDNADGIPTAADVRVAGFQVGKVTDVTSDKGHPGKTKVVMDITDSASVPHTNAFAKIRPKTLLGEKYVDLDPGTADHDALPSGASLLNTSTSVSNDQIFNAFDAQTRKDERAVLQSLDTAVQYRDGDVQKILPQLDQVVKNLQPVARVYAEDQPVVDTIFTNLSTVMRTLADEHVQLGAFLASANGALKAISDRDASLIGALQQIGQFDQKLNRVVAATIGPQHQGIDKLTPTLDSQHAFIADVIYPQPACGNRLCGLDHLFTGTLIGQLNYPNDQLSVTTPEGGRVTNEWASMFSAPQDTYHAGNPLSHSALNIVLSEDCQTVQATASIVDLGSAVNGLLKSACNGALVHTGNAATASTPATGTASTTSATDAVLQQLGMTS